MFPKYAALALSAMAMLISATSQSASHEVGLMVFGYNGDPSAYTEWNVNINQLAVRKGRGHSVATHAQFGGPVYNVDVNAVQCRAYGDVVGTIPVGGAFDVMHIADFGGNPVGMYSILCYIVGDQGQV